MKTRSVIVKLRTEKDVESAINEIKKMRNTYSLDANKTKQLAQRIRDKFMKPMLKKLQDIPPRRNYPDDYPLEWTSEKQRKYVMGFVLKGKPYQRSGDTARKWKYRVTTRNNKIEMKIENRSPHSKFVYGDIGMRRGASRELYLKPKQRFHTITGWPSAYEIIQDAVKEAKKDARQKISNWIKTGQMI